MTHVAVGPQMIDVRSPEHEVEVLIGDGRLHVNVDGVCRLRIYEMELKILRIHKTKVAADTDRTVERDILTQPYTADEQRVVDWLHERAPDVGGGDDPIGFLLASYDYMRTQRQQTKAALAEVLEWIKNWDPPMIHDAEWPETARKISEALNG